MPVRAPRDPEAFYRLHAFASMLAVFNESTKCGFAREARTKCCTYPGHNFCNGYREGTKQPFLAWPLRADHTRAIKQASYWDASIPVSCLRGQGPVFFGYSYCWSPASCWEGLCPLQGPPLPLLQLAALQPSCAASSQAAASAPPLPLSCSFPLTGAPSAWRWLGIGQ